MTLKNRKYYQLVASLAEKKRQQASESLKLVGSLPQQLLPPKQAETPNLSTMPLKTEEELAKEIEERSKMISPLEALQLTSEQTSSTSSWEPFLPRSKL